MSTTQTVPTMTSTASRSPQSNTAASGSEMPDGPPTMRLNLSTQSAHSLTPAPSPRKNSSSTSRAASTVTTDIGDANKDAPKWDLKAIRKGLSTFLKHQQHYQLFAGMIIY